MTLSNEDRLRSMRSDVAAELGRSRRREFGVLSNVGPGRVNETPDVVREVRRRAVDELARRGFNWVTLQEDGARRLKEMADRDRRRANGGRRVVRSPGVGSGRRHINSGRPRKNG